MLMLIFYVGNDRYALDSSQVVEVIPRVNLRKIHHAPEYVAGLFNYRGAIVPVIDLCHLIQGDPSRSYLSTRIIMVTYREKERMTHHVGLMAERVTETLNKPETQFLTPGIQVDEAPYLGEIITDERGIIQCVRVEYLLSDDRAGVYLLPGEEN